MSLIASWHPTYAIFRNPYEHGVFRGDLARFARVIKGTQRPGPKKLIINPTVNHIRQVFQSGPRVAVDIETAPEHPSRPWTGKDPTRAKLKVIGIGNCEVGLAFDARRNHVDLKAELKKWFMNEKVTKVFHNGIWFDQRILKRYGFNLVNCEDTRDARMALSPTSPLGLGYLGTVYDDPNAWKEDDGDDSKGLVFTEKMEDLLRYCAQDCVETARVDEGIMREEEWNSPRVQRLYQLHKDLSLICAEMHRTGFMVDTDMRAYLAWGLEQEYHDWEEIFLSAVGIPSMRCTPNDLRKLIYKRYETKEIHRFSLPDPIDPAMYTEKGQVSVGFDALVQLMIDPYCSNELRVLIRHYWKAESAWKARATFVVSDKVSQAIGKDGRLRPGWNSCGTDTGRFSCSEPNVMNLEQYLRAMYRAAQGKVLIHADYSQLELRVMAAVSGDEILKGAIAAGDVYSEDAIAIYGLPQDMDVKALKPKARKAAKQVHLAFQYGAGTPKVYGQVLVEDMDAKYSEVARIHEAMKKRYKGTVDYWFREQKEVLKAGYSESKVLQRRRAYPAEPPITEIANYPIQSTASDVMNLAFIRVRNRMKEIPSANLVDQLHDALDVEAWEKDADKIQALVQEEMEKPVEINGERYIFPVEIKVATSWDQL